MEMKNRILKLYKEAAIQMKEAAEPDSPEHQNFDFYYGQRAAYSRILKELYGVRKQELQQILNTVNAKGRG